MSVCGKFSWFEVMPPDGGVKLIVRAGVDRVELDEFRNTLDVAGDAFVRRIFVPAEIAYCAGRVDRLATRFAAKEAASKLLGTGIRDLSWHEVEIVTAPHGEPHLVLHERARARADDLGIASICVSLTHTTVAAEAFVVALCMAPEAGQWLREESSRV